ncbi:MAG: hypothetical protein Q9180_007136 [Flavoplaca navasiana]
MYVSLYSLVGGWIGVRLVSAIKTYITNTVEVLISQHAVVSILVEKVPAAEVNGKGRGKGEAVNSTSSFIASYTGYRLPVVTVPAA